MTDLGFGLILFLLGLAFGSFLNVFILRYNPDGKLFSLSRVSGRSHCPSCGKILSWFELIPVFSFIVQSGRCRQCKVGLTLQYPLVEIISGLVFVLTPSFLKHFFVLSVVGRFDIFLLASSVIWILFFLSLLCVFFIDLRHYVIPNSLNLFIFILAIAWLVLGVNFGIFDSFSGGSFLGVFSSAFSFSTSAIWSHVIGAAFGSLFFLLVVLVSKGRAMGMGDVKLMAGIGLLFGWPDVGMIMVLSFVIGAIIGLFLMAGNKKKMSDAVPFGPFIAFASFITFFLGAGLMGLYFSIMGM